MWLKKMSRMHGRRNVPPYGVNRPRTSMKSGKINLQMLGRMWLETNRRACVCVSPPQGQEAPAFRSKQQLRVHIDQIWSIRLFFEQQLRGRTDQIWSIRLFLEQQLRRRIGQIWSIRLFLEQQLGGRVDQIWSIRPPGLLF
jgi:hypothetical protein